MPQDTGFTIRPATDEDVPRLLALIQDLAVYEKLTHEVVATEETLRASLFGDSPAAEALLAFADDEPAGFAVYFHTFSTFLARRGMYLHDLYVSPEVSTPWTGHTAAATCGGHSGGTWLRSL